MLYAIGTPGQRVRLYIDPANDAEARLQLRDGEELIPAQAIVMNATIADDLTLVPPPAGPAA